MAKVPPPDFNKIFDLARKRFGGFGKIAPLASIAGFFGITGYTIYHGIFFVPGGYRAVKFNAITGLHDKCYGEGANLSIPYIETPILFDVRQRPTEVISSSGSRDLQIINMAVRVLYKPQADQLHHIYRHLGVDYAETVLPSLINEIMRAVIAQFNASELLSRRPEVSARIATTLRERAAHFFIDVSDVSITQLTFGKEYTAAVESKQIAQQMAERAKFHVDKALQEKKGAIILAEGEAEAAKLIGEAVKNNPGFMDLRRIEAAKGISKAVADGRGQYYLNSEALMLHVGEGGASTAVGFGAPTAPKK